MERKESRVTEKICSRGKNVEKYKNNVECNRHSLREHLFEERLKKSLKSWTKKRINFTFAIDDRQLHWEIYDLLGNNVLKPEILEKLMCELITNNDILPVQLYSRLEDFYQLWCRGEFIDALPENNLPQQKKLQLRSACSSAETRRSRTLSQNLDIGLRQIDINAGLNVMILLLELHRIAQQQHDLKEKIIFSPSGYRDTDNFFTSQLLRVINYSDTLAIGHFSTVVGEFLKGGDFRDAYLGDANLTGVNLSNANLSNSFLGDANLTGANLRGAILLGADLSGVDMSQVILNEADLSGVLLSEANLSGADLRDAILFGSDLSYTNLNSANLSGSNLSGAIFNGANLSHTNLRYALLEGADLSDANLEKMTWNENQQWECVRGLEKAVNVPNSLRVHLGLS